MSEMPVSDSISLDPYIEIPDSTGASFGGSQMWFPNNSSGMDRLTRKGGCGLIAAADILLFTSRKEGLSLSPLTGKLQASQPDSRTNYLELIRTMRRRYPMFPMVGSFNIEVPLFVNQSLRRLGSTTRLHWALLPTKRSLLKTVRASLHRGFPVVLLIAPKVLPFTKLKGVSFYSLQNGFPVKQAGPVRAHFVTVTGIHRPVLAELPLFYEISSWGKKYYINSDELAEYMSRACLPLSGSLFYLKSGSK